MLIGLITQRLFHQDGIVGLGTGYKWCADHIFIVINFSPPWLFVMDVGGFL